MPPWSVDADSIERTNRSILVYALLTLGAALLFAAITLVVFWLYVRSGRGVSCQTDALVRGLTTDVNSLLAQAHNHVKHIKLPGLLKAPKACPQ